ncbi:HvfB family MNIO-type RiPP peptide maturase [Pseudoalteromonas shioyasakiensis]|uniref:HvfB family MNIO-type RiPP peptide maturase n=1 Tax=Pseudoalteromonas shioyasakiensis TaxID=1190813 RepID=UPI00403893F4
MGVSNKSEFGMVGLGLRREMLDELLIQVPKQIDFMEVAPENWLKLGGRYKKQFKTLTGAHDFLCHGLSLSIGAPQPLDIDFVKALKAFFKEHGIKRYSEHLSYCSGTGHMYDLMPIPFTEPAIDHVVKRIKQVQDILEQQITIENVSYYAAPGQELTELEFTNEILAQADCKLLLDVNNIYVNSVNHGYDAQEFLQGLPSERIDYGHVAGHYNEADDLIVDTHGADVIASVWELLDKAYEVHGVFPTLLERDFNIPTMSELTKELDIIIKLQAKHGASKQQLSPVL